MLDIRVTSVKNAAYVLLGDSQFGLLVSAVKDNKSDKRSQLLRESFSKAATCGVGLERVPRRHPSKVLVRMSMLDRGTTGKTTHLNTFPNL